MTADIQDPPVRIQPLISRAGEHRDESTGIDSVEFRQRLKALSFYLKPRIGDKAIP